MRKRYTLFAAVINISVISTFAQDVPIAVAAQCAPLQELVHAYDDPAGSCFVRQWLSLDPRNQISPEQKECMEQEVKNRNMFLKQLNDCIAEHNGASATMPASHCEHPQELLQYASGLHAQIQQDQIAIQRLGFRKTDAEVAAWEELAADARSEFLKQTFDIVLDLTTGAIEEAIKRGEKIYPINVNDVIKKYEIQNESVANALYALASKNKNQPLWSSRVIAQIKVLTTAKDLIFLQDLGAVLQMALGSSSNLTIRNYGLLMSDLQFAAASIYNNVFRRISIFELRKLGDLAEMDLKALQAVSNDLRNNVGALHLVQRELDRCKTN